MIDSLDQNPEKVFTLFSEAMYCWNLKAIEMKKEGIPYNTRLEEMKSDIKQIFDQYLTKRKRTYGRLNAPDFSNPPEYNLLTNEILSCNVEDKKAFIEVQETVGLKRKLRYTLHKKREGWKVDKRESYRASQGKWEIVPL